MSDSVTADCVDLRSDTVTTPTAGMREAMRRAVVGDDGRRGSHGDYGDPTVTALQEHAARLFEREAALLFPSGTMANLVAVRTYAPADTRVVVGRRSHIYADEPGTFDPSLSGARPVLLDDSSGLPDPAGVDAALATGASLVCLENTHNTAGGVPVPAHKTDELCAVAHGRGVPVHVDGARIFNAAVALASSPAELTRSADSVQFCLSKGLGAPVGSMLVGRRDFIDRAREQRRMVGGQMRQSGVLAAAGLVALKDWRPRIAADHRRAAVLIDALGGIPGLTIEPQGNPTNIVLLRVPDGAAIDCVRRAEQAGVLLLARDDRTVRCVLHSDIDDEQLDRVCATLPEVMRICWQ